MSDDRMRTLVACGAAGGIAATFNAPIAGVFFALEVILGEFTTRAFGIVVISSVTASVIGRAAFGNATSFPVPAYQLVNIGEFAIRAARRDCWRDRRRLHSRYTRLKMASTPCGCQSSSSHVIGMLRRSDIVRAYSQAMLNRLESETHKPALPSDLRGTRIVEVPVESGGALEDRSIAELQLPPVSLVVTVQRGAETIIPRGDTRLQPRDCLQILVHEDAIATLHEHLASLSPTRRSAA